MILAQLVFRGWAISKAWFQQDDFAFMQRSLSSNLDPTFLLTPHVGHLMPAGFLLSWINNAIDPLNFAIPAGELLAMEAMIGIGCLRLMIHLFGARWGVLPPLALLLLSPISFPAFSWWAAGVNQLPVLIVFFFGLHSHVSYLRSGARRHAVYTLLWTLFGLAFCEKTVLVYWLYGLVALSYFATGHLMDRLTTVWREYRFGVVSYSALVVAYLPYYYVKALNFDASTVNDHPLGDLAFNMAGKAFATGVIGGPVRWASANVFSGIAAPSELLQLGSWLAIVGVVYVGASTRERSKRAWLLVVAILGTDILLVATGRAFIVGAAIGLEYRYQTEVIAATSIALGLAFMPLLGARETVVVKRRHPLLESPGFVATAIAAVAAVSTYTVVQFMALHLEEWSPRTYFTNFAQSLPQGERKVPMADRAVPERIWSGFAFPGNLYSKMFMPYADRLAYPQVSQDSLFMVDDVGHVAPVVIDTVRRNVPGKLPGCGYRVAQESRVTIPLDGPVIGAGWWLRVGYVATGNSPVTITVGQHRFHTRVTQGVHSFYLEGDGEYSSIKFSALADGVALCTNDVTLGMPQPYKRP